MTRPSPPRFAGDRIVLLGPPIDGGYRFISVIPPWFRPPNILPYYGAIVLVIILMGAILAAHLAEPLRRLRRVVDRFGRGDLAARSGLAAHGRDRRAGSRAFDEMAGRIEILLTAERRLLQDVSHELRSPLARLDVAVDLASTSDGPFGEFLAHIRRDVEPALHSGRRAAPTDAGRRRPRRSRARGGRPGRPVAGDGRRLRLEAEASGCRLDLRSADPATIQGSPELLRRAVENVVRNAIRHAPAGTAVEIGLERAAGTATIAVRDRGPGVPEDLLGAIFEPFFRVEGHRSRVDGGTGLGLAIARRAVEPAPWPDRGPQRPPRALGLHRAADVGTGLIARPRLAPCHRRISATAMADPVPRAHTSWLRFEGEGIELSIFGRRAHASASFPRRLDGEGLRNRRSPMISAERRADVATVTSAHFLVEKTVNGITVARFADTELLSEDVIREIEEELWEIAHGLGAVSLLLSFGRVKLMSSGLLGVLIQFGRRFEKMGGRLKLCDIAPGLREVFRIAGYERSFDIYPDEMRAFDAF